MPADTPASWRGAPDASGHSWCWPQLRLSSTSPMRRCLPWQARSWRLSHPGQEAALTSAAIIVAQLATDPDGAARRMGECPRAQATARCGVPRAAHACADLCLYRHPAWIIAGQILDGLGGGLFDALLPLVLADITAGHRPLQCEPWAHQHGPGHRRLAQPCRGGSPWSSERGTGGHFSDWR